MKKRIAFRKLNRTPAHKWSMLRNMVSSLIEHERIVTTEPKAKELRHLADQMITLAKKGQHIPNTSSSKDKHSGVVDVASKTPGELLHHRRRAAKIVRGDWNVTKLFEVLGPRYRFREGGYTRVMKLARKRAGDNAPMAVIEYVDRPGEIRAARPPPSLLLDPELSPLEGVEEALRKMGIAPVGELVSEDEQRAIEKELQQQQDDDEGSSDDKDESSSPEEGATTPTK
jgi:large subunit ribosomal protein L17